MRIQEVFSRGMEFVSMFESKHQKRMAIVYSLASSLVMTLMYLCVNILRHDYTAIQIVNFRMVFGMILNTFLCSSQKIKIYTDNKPLFRTLVIRAVLGGLGMVTVFMCISNMKLSEAVVIINTNPIWTTILATFILGEKFQKKRLVFCLVSFLGILVVSRPRFLFGDENEDASIEQKKKANDYNELVGVTFGVIGSIMIAIVAMFVRKLSHDFKCPGAVQMQHTFYIGSLITALFLPFTVTGETKITLNIIVALCLLAVFGVLGQLLLAKAMSLEKASVVAPLQYVQVVFSFLIDIFVLKVDILLSSIIGVTFILIGSIGVLI